jgi:MFS transporter, ACS family, glucarate transporter
VTTTGIIANPPPPVVEKATRVRYVVLTMAVAVAVLLYLDRYCLSTSDRAIKATLGLSEGEVAVVLSIFYLPYAFGQLVLGYLADRFGARRVLTLLMLAWSTVTGLMGLARGFVDLYLCRLACGLFESGAYPACAGIIRRWIPAEKRGMASGIVSLGGRVAAAVTPLLTVLLMGIAETALPDVAKWRPVFFLYGTIGIVLAIVFWIVHRDRPELNPAVNAAERNLISAGDPPPSAVPFLASRFAQAIVTNRSLWICSAVQFGSNFGWVFLLTYLNRYLLEVHKADEQTRGIMCSLVALIGLPALLLGGWLTDATNRRLGRRWGRALPMALPRFVAAGLYFTVALLSLAWLEPTETSATPILTATQSWAIVLLLGFVAFFSDLTLPAIWAYSMDVGGKTVGFVLGWGNMWGNLGAFASPMILNEAVKAYGWDAVFWICGGVFITIAVLSLFVDATDIVDA